MNTHFENPYEAALNRIPGVKEVRFCYPRTRQTCWRYDHDRLVEELYIGVRWKTDHGTEHFVAVEPRFRRVVTRFRLLKRLLRQRVAMHHEEFDVEATLHHIAVLIKSTVRTPAVPSESIETARGGAVRPATDDLAHHLKTPLSAEIFPEPGTKYKDRKIL